VFEEENMDDAFDQKNTFNKLFDIEAIMHEIESDEFWIRVQETESVDDQFKLFFEETA
jgi:hypothetical protein